MKTFTTDHIVASIHDNPYEPGAEVYIETEGATQDEIIQLVKWLNQYLTKDERQVP